MGRKFIADERSQFYPPRARWYGVVFSIGSAIRRQLALDRVKMPQDMKVLELGAGFLVPGLGVYLRGARLWGLVALAAWVALFMVYITWMGNLAASVAFGLMISLHCSSFVYYCNPLVAQASFRSRMTFTILVSLAMTLLFYWPLQRLFR